MLKFEIIINHLSYLKTSLLLCFCWTLPRLGPRTERFSTKCLMDWLHGWFAPGASGDSVELRKMEEKWTYFIIRSLAEEAPKNLNFSEMAGSDWNTCQLLRSYSPKRSEFSPDRFRKVSGRRVQPWFVRIVWKEFQKSWQPPRLFSNLVDTVETLEVCSRANHG